VHRDLKPDNVMIERATGRALLMDFGIARAIAAPADGAGLTRVGEVVGTPEFMSPEQATGDVVDGRSDLYALALVAYFALTGELAIQGETMQRVLVQQLTQPVPSVGARRPDLPPALVAVVDRCARKEPAERYASAEELVEALEAAQLAAPDVPAPVRQFAQELGTLGLTFVFGAVVIYQIWEIILARGWSPMDALFQQMIVVAVLGARVLQAVGEWRRLRALGFDGATVRRGFAIVVEERAAARTTLAAQPAARARRRRVVWSAVAMFVLSVVAVAGARAGRTRTGPMSWSVPPWGVALFFLSSALLGASIVLLVRSPLRMPIGERLFRWVWLGPTGRWLFGDADAGTAVGRTMPPTGVPTGEPAYSGATSDTRAPVDAEQVTSPAASHTAGHDPVAALEARVSALERWRTVEEADRLRR
jgi:hypothetical protein